MLKHFLKYQSLGNDFVLFDWYKKPNIFIQNTLEEDTWPHFVRYVCNRQFGVGADGVLILRSSPEASLPEVLIFNADGTQAETCLNGLRCIAHYLFIRYHFAPSFKIKFGPRIVDCFAVITDKNHPTQVEITTNVGRAVYEKPLTISTTVGEFAGHSVSVGNPHFIVFQSTTFDWMKEHGKIIESHPTFPAKTNVEFVWQENKKPLHPACTHHYSSAVYERGAGPTLACSSGATAITHTLLTLGKVAPQEKIELAMPGGTLISWVDEQEQIILQASAQLVFSGDLEHYD